MRTKCVTGFILQAVFLHPLCIFSLILAAMKPTYLLFALFFGTGLILSSCKQDPISSGIKIQPMAANASAAHPAFVYHHSDRVWSKGNWVDTYSIAVSDSDGTHPADVYKCASSIVKTYSATWSASGTSASFVEAPVSGSGTHYIKAVDISVPTSGKNAGVPQG